MVWTNELIGKRALMKVNRGRFGSDRVEEYRLLEVSPSGRWLKFLDTNGTKFWVPIENAALVEILKDLRAERMAERNDLDT